MGKEVYFLHVRKVDEKKLPDGIVKTDSFDTFPDRSGFHIIYTDEKYASDWEKEIGILRETQSTELDVLAAAEKMLGMKFESYSVRYRGEDPYAYTVRSRDGFLMSVPYEDLKRYKEVRKGKAYFYEAMHLGDVEDAYLLDTSSIEGRVLRKGDMEKILKEYVNSEDMSDDFSYYSTPLIPCLKVMFAVNDGAMIVCEVG